MDTPENTRRRELAAAARKAADGLTDWCVLMIKDVTREDPIKMATLFKQAEIVDRPIKNMLVDFGIPGLLACMSRLASALNGTAKDYEGQLKSADVILSPDAMAIAKALIESAFKEDNNERPKGSPEDPS